MHHNGAFRDGIRVSINLEISSLVQRAATSPAGTRRHLKFTHVLPHQMLLSLPSSLSLQTPPASAGRQAASHRLLCSSPPHPAEAEAFARACSCAPPTVGFLSMLPKSICPEKVGPRTWVAVWPAQAQILLVLSSRVCRAPVLLGSRATGLAKDFKFAS